MLDPMTQPATTPDDANAPRRTPRRAAAAGAMAPARPNRAAGSNGAVQTVRDGAKTGKGRPKPTGPRRAPAGPVSRSSGAGDEIPALGRHLLETVREHYPQADLASVERAFDLAVEAHANQKRATGEPYVTHPIASAQITAELGIDPVAVTAALLHDVPEDTEYALQDIDEQFGPEVARLVDGVTKLSKFSTHSHEQQQAEN